MNTASTTTRCWTRCASRSGTALVAIVVAVTLSAAGPTASDQGERPLRIHFIDVEGGQATLIVSPSGESMLVDAGYPGFEGRDADRIASAARGAGLARIDYLVVTHYHRDHVGGVPALVERVPVLTFVDHGPNVEKGELPDALFAAYAVVRAKGRHMLVKPGDRIPIAGLDVRVLSSAGDVIREPLPGGGGANPRCSEFTAQPEDLGENAQSVGLLIAHGRFRMLNLGDLTWNTEHRLVCPANLIGDVDVYLTTHHGLPSSGQPALVHAVRPRVAIMNNGAKKGGSPEAWRIVRSSPGLEDFWQLHYAVDAGSDHNVPGTFIANPDETTSHAISLEATSEGGFTVTNARNGHRRVYQPRS